MLAKKIENETKEQKGGFLKLLLGTVGADLLRNLLRGKETIRAGQRATATSQYFEANMPEQGMIKAGQDF